MTTTTDNAHPFASVWDAISDTPDEAANLALRSSLMTAIIDQIESFGWSGTKAARNLGVTQPRMSDLHRGKISRFSLDALVVIAAKLGISVDIMPPTEAEARSIKEHEMA